MMLFAMLGAMASAATITVPTCAFISRRPLSTQRHRYHHTSSACTSILHGQYQELGSLAGHGSRYCHYLRHLRRRSRLSTAIAASDNNDEASFAAVGAMNSIASYTDVYDAADYNANIGDSGYGDGGGGGGGIQVLTIQCSTSPLSANLLSEFLLELGCLSASVDKDADVVLAQFPAAPWQMEDVMQTVTTTFGLEDSPLTYTISLLGDEWKERVRLAMPEPLISSLGRVRIFSAWHLAAPNSPSISPLSISSFSPKSATTITNTTTTTPLPRDIVLAEGIGWGAGDHPTTALCVDWLEEVLCGTGSQDLLAIVTDDHLGGGGGVDTIDVGSASRQQNTDVAAERECHAKKGQKEVLKSAGKCNGRKGPRVLDYGSGSGILALTALALGAAQAVGVEVDVDAIKHAQRSAELNALPAEFFTPAATTTTNTTTTTTTTTTINAAADTDIDTFTKGGLATDDDSVMSLEDEESDDIVTLRMGGVYGANEASFLYNKLKYGKSTEKPHLSSFFSSSSTSSVPATTVAAMTTKSSADIGPLPADGRYQLFDICIANIFPGPLMMLAPQLAQRTKPGGLLALAGLRERVAVNEVIPKYFLYFEDLTISKRSAPSEVQDVIIKSDADAAADDGDDRWVLITGRRRS